MSSASRWSGARRRIKLPSRDCSRLSTWEIRWSCSSAIRSRLATSFTYGYRRIRGGGYCRERHFADSEGRRSPRPPTASGARVDDVHRDSRHPGNTLARGGHCVSVRSTSSRTTDLNYSFTSFPRMGALAPVDQALRASYDRLFPLRRSERAGDPVLHGIYRQVRCWAAQCYRGGMV